MEYVSRNIGKNPKLGAQFIKPGILIKKAAWQSMADMESEMYMNTEGSISGSMCLYRLDDSIKVETVAGDVESEVSNLTFCITGIDAVGFQKDHHSTGSSTLIAIKKYLVGCKAFQILGCLLFHHIYQHKRMEEA